MNQYPTSSKTSTLSRIATLFFRSAFLWALLVFVILSALLYTLVFQQYQLLHEKQKKGVYEAASNAKDKLQQNLSYSLAVTRVLSMFIDENGQVNNFDSIASEILKTTDKIDAIQLVPDGVIRYVYPFKENESVIGYDILHDSARKEEAFKAIVKKEIFYAGPFPLKQGGMGVVGRLPVYRNNKFWGFSAVVIKLETLLKSAEMDSTGNNGFYYQLSKINPQSGVEQYFLPYKEDFLNAHATSVIVPNGEWRISVLPVQKPVGAGYLFVLGIMGFLLAVVCAYGVYWLAARPSKLQKLILQRNRQLKESKENYSVLFEKSPLPIWIYNPRNLKLIEVNHAAVELLGYTKEEMLEKDLQDLFSETDFDSFLRENKTISNELRHLGNWTHITKYGEPVEQMIFTHNVFFKGVKGRLLMMVDISDAMRMERDLIYNEEKYRSLIEQASDGIVIFDLDGKILEVNKSALRLSGYKTKEMLGRHMSEFIPEENLEEMPLRISELLQGKNLLTERKILNKDGSLVDVEVNSKMASTHTIIGFVREITERKRNAAQLEYQARLLNNISDAVFSLDKDRKIRSWNNACTGLFGFSSEQIIGKAIPEVVSFHYIGSTNEEVFTQVQLAGRWKGEFVFKHPVSQCEIHTLSSIDIVNNNDGMADGYIIMSRDITNRIKAEEEIKNSNERFELIAAATKDIVWDFDAVNNKTWGNKKLYQVLGLSDDTHTITLHHLKSTIHPDDRVTVDDEFKRVIKENLSTYTGEFRIKNSKGVCGYYYQRAFITYDSSGKPQRIIGAMQDITEREKIRNQIIREKDLSDSVIKSLPGIFYLFNAEGKFLRWNKNYELVTGYTKEEITQLLPISFFPDDEKQMVAEKIANVFENGFETVEAHLLLKNGCKVLYYFTGQVIEYEGEKCLLGVGLDFSGKAEAARIIKESEERYRALVENATEALLVIDVEKKVFVNVSESACRLFKMTKHELLQIQLNEVTPDKQPGGQKSDVMIEKFIQLAIDGSHPSFEMALIDNEKNLIPCEISLAKLPSDKHSLIRCSITDITERKKAAEEINNHADLMRDLYNKSQRIREEERTHIAREIHDELGQQLTALKMDIHWIGRKISNKENAVHEKLSDAMGLVDTTIQTVRKISTELRPSMLDDLGLVAALEWQGEEFSRRSSIKIEPTFFLDEAEVGADTKTAVFRIYQELLTNVARHAEANSVKASVFIKDRSLHLVVEDNGHGFDLDKVLSKKTLGLKGINERTSQLNGTCDIKSKPGRGTLISISIPL